MQQGQKNVASLLFPSVLLALLAAVLMTAPALAQECEAAQKASLAERLESSEFYEVISVDEIQVREGVEYESVQSYSANGEEDLVIRFGFNLGDELNRLVADTIECRCFIPSVCPEDTCAVSTTGGNAKCRGGCYREDGTACVSCQFYPA